MCELSNHVGVREVTNEAATESTFKMSDYSMFENRRPDLGQNTLTAFPPPLIAARTPTANQRRTVDMRGVR